MKILKKIISIMLILTIAVGISACAGGKSDQEEVPEPETGAWTINQQQNKAKLPENVEKAFNKAIEKNTGSTLVPVAYIGSQVVAGMNYMILCQALTEEQEASYKIAIIYADLEGNAELTSLNDFDYVKYTEGEGTKSKGGIAGGWYAASDTAGSEIPENVINAYGKATEAVCWEWAEVDLLAYLGSQVVSGTNYAILCHGKLTEDESVDQIFVAKIYEDSEGNAEVSNIHTIDLAELTGN